MRPVILVGGLVTFRAIVLFALRDNVSANDLSRLIRRGLLRAGARVLCRPGHRLRTELSVGPFYPSRDGWNSDDTTITCSVSQPDESPMTQSLKD